MIDLSVASWADWKSNIIGTKQLLTQYSENPVSYHLYAAEENFMWTLKLPKDGGADVLDMEGNYKSTFNKPLVAKAEAGRPDRISPSPQPAGTMKTWKGAFIDIADGESSGYCEFSYPSNVYVKEGWAYCKDAKDGDSVDAGVYVGSTLALEYCTDIPVFQEFPATFAGEDCTKLQSGLKVRITYTRANTSGAIKVGVCIAVYK